MIIAPETIKSIYLRDQLTYDLKVVLTRDDLYLLKLAQIFLKGILKRYCCDILIFEKREQVMTTAQNLTLFTQLPKAKSCRRGINNSQKKNAKIKK